MTRKRRALHAYVSDDAHDQWHNVAVEWGVSVSALLEALAPTLNHETAATDEGAPPASIVRAARQIDAQRRRRS